ncbi:hypothetical protein DFH94DRAFT_754771 [Russula ochroleuca]|uniref:Uncharacterized protein n=1 Tax=Russula ochroleuca TaxID=152965 RepID=A0A9P5T5W7_9AGAM|nr:hypothetical protein DFH94DRAFT_754771 [Russula ochroleuca]
MHMFVASLLADLSKPFTNPRAEWEETHKSKTLAAHIGFEIKNERTVDTTYVNSKESMPGCIYHSAFWTATKKVVVFHYCSHGCSNGWCIVWTSQTARFTLLISLSSVVELIYY